jgi:hypothetical protein
MLTLGHLGHSWDTPKRLECPSYKSRLARLCALLGHLGHYILIGFTCARAHARTRTHIGLQRLKECPKCPTPRLGHVWRGFGWDMGECPRVSQSVPPERATNYTVAR